MIKCSRIKFRLKVIVFGLIAGLFSSLGISVLIVMVEKVMPVPAGSLYLGLISAITHSHSYSVYMIIAGLVLHFAAGSIIGIVMAIPFAMQIDNKRNPVIIINKYAPIYGLGFGFALWLFLFIPITYYMVMPAINDIKNNPIITQQDPTGRIAFFVISDILSMQNSIIIGALPFNMFYGLVTAIIINSLYVRHVTRIDKGSVSYTSSIDKS